jgi:hypothetical protein
MLIPGYFQVAEVDLVKYYQGMSNIEEKAEFKSFCTDVADFLREISKEPSAIQALVARARLSFEVHPGGLEESFAAAVTSALEGLADLIVEAGEEVAK